MKKIFTKYYSILNIRDKYFLLNTYNDSLIELDNDSNNRIIGYFDNPKLNILTDEEIKILENQGFFIDEDIEKNNINKMFEGYNNSKHIIGTSAKIDISITNNCNFRCSYCFENCFKDSDVVKNAEYSKLHFRDNLINLVDMIMKKGVKNLDVVWYGGEPLIEKELICFFNDVFINICNKNNAIYSNIIVTNGYFIDEILTNKLVNQNIKYIQITLDGTKDVHNQRRTTPNNDDTFSKLINNIILLLQSSIEVVVRINVDVQNSENITELLYFLNEKVDRVYREKYFFVDFGRVFGSDNSLSHYEYEKIYHDLYLLAVKFKFITPTSGVGDLSAFCSAETDTLNFVIDHFGNIYNCWNDIYNFEMSVGNISDIKDLDNIAEFRINNEYINEFGINNVNNNKCLKCSYIRYCRGLCPHTRKMILLGMDDNLYENEQCKLLVKQRIETSLKAYLINKEE